MIWLQSALYVREESVLEKLRSDQILPYLCRPWLFELFQATASLRQIYWHKNSIKSLRWLFPAWPLNNRKAQFCLGRIHSQTHNLLCCIKNLRSLSLKRLIKNKGVSTGFILIDMPNLRGWCSSQFLKPKSQHFEPLDWQDLGKVMGAHPVLRHSSFKLPNCRSLVV